MLWTAIEAHTKDIFKAPEVEECTGPAVSDAIEEYLARRSKAKPRMSFHLVVAAVTQAQAPMALRTSLYELI